MEKIHKVYSCTYIKTARANIKQRPLLLLASTRKLIAYIEY